MAGHTNAGVRSLPERLASMLSGPVMGFLALGALALPVIPEVFPISAPAGRALDACEWFIVGAFALEYGVNLWITEDTTRKFVTDPWRLLDLAIILGPLFSLLPQVNDSLRSTPVLRLLRLSRAAAFGVRAGAALRDEDEETEDKNPPELRGSKLLEGHQPLPLKPDSDEFRLPVNGEPAWLHTRNVSAGTLETLAKASGLRKDNLKWYLSDASFPHVDPESDPAYLFTWLPTVRATEAEKADSHASEKVSIQRSGVHLLYTQTSVFSMSEHDFDLHAAVAEALPSLNPPVGPFAPRMLCALLGLVVSRHEDVAGRLERAVREMEKRRAHDSSNEFFKNATGLKQELSAARGDLWRLTGLLKSLAATDTTLPGLDESQRKFLRALAAKAKYLHETVDHNREAIIALIELHVSLVSFEMNKFMRLLAAVSLLGLIPAVIGGLFGMNLAGNPWPITLPQVAFGVFMAMLVCVYIFVVRGWLR